MSDAASVSYPLFALAVSSARPDETFATLQDLADAIVLRAGPATAIDVRRGALGRPSGSCEALFVYVGSDAWPEVYALGLGGDVDTLQAAIHASRAHQTARAA